MPESVSNYEKLNELEANAYARVFAGYDHAGERRVRIIEFHSQLAASPDRWERIWSDAVGSIGIASQHSVSVHAPVRGERWIVTEWLDSNVHELMSQRRLSPDEVRNILRQGLRALCGWHERNRYHGDIRPANLLFNDGDFIKLNYSPGLELGGQVLIPERGLKYCAPELFDPGTFGDIGPGVDMYSLGFSCLEMLSGAGFDQRCYVNEGDNAERDAAWMSWHISCDAKLGANDAASNVPPDLAQVIDGLTQKKVSQRITNARVALSLLKSGDDAPVQRAPRQPEPPRDSNNKMDHNRPDDLKQLWDKKPVRIASMIGVFLLFVTLLMVVIPEPKEEVPPAANGAVKVETTVPVETRNVRISSTPTGASILLDGVEQKEKTDAVLKLTHGKHTLKLSAEKFQELTHEFVVATGKEELRLDKFDLKPKEEPKMSPPPTRTIFLSSEPSGAEILIDDKPQSKTTPAEIVLAPGVYQLSLKSRPHRKSAKRQITVGAGTEKQLLDLITLTPDITTNSIGMEFVNIPVGEFQMGADPSDVDADEDEQPQQEIRIKMPFQMGAHEVTIGQFREFVTKNKYESDAEKGEGGIGFDEDSNRFRTDKKFNWQQTGWPQSDRHPVVNVSWNDAVAFCEWLSREEKRSYSLPTEAEWEYACRAGIHTRYSCGNEIDGLVRIANVADQALRMQFPNRGSDCHPGNDQFIFSAPVGSYGDVGRNGFGLFDMHGNVSEWCLNTYESQYRDLDGINVASLKVESDQNRVVRGGNWSFTPSTARCSARQSRQSGAVYAYIGFRVVIRDDVE